MIVKPPNIVMIVQYDYIQPGDNAKEVGQVAKGDAEREKNGDVITFSRKKVMEEDGTYLVQTIRKLNPINERATDRGIAWFGRFNNNELEIIKAYFDPDVNFTYDSIAGKTDAAPESMAEGYKKATKMVVKDGKVEMTKY